MGGVVMAGPSTYGLPPKPQPGSILRSRVGHASKSAPPGSSRHAQRRARHRALPLHPLKWWWIA